MVREQLRTTTTVLGRAYNVVAHHQAAMPEQLLAHEPNDPEHDDQEPEDGPGETIDMKALRALRASRTDVEALDLTADRLRHLQQAFAKRATPAASAWTARCARTASRRTARRSPDRTEAGRLATECTRWSTPVRCGQPN
ncbi:hypothetical protein [Streptomyces sp. NBU3104]|uniref:hypothetical protein n=1 Tax=Streptomyces sp. NBU3104 TaxID=2911367 RepID=UPI001EDBD558|nr:hypothetical protein [Streptomyces sp. NBU3104]UKL07420.1 hypothetical protein L2I08_31175 [Streptomyces sp. NBU3104]